MYLGNVLEIWGGQDRRLLLHQISAAMTPQHSEPQSNRQDASEDGKEGLLQRLPLKAPWEAVAGTNYICFCSV